MPSDWGGRDVLVGTLRTKEQLDVALSCGFYHIPADFLKNAEGIAYVAIYQSRRLFGKDAGIWWYGKVKATRVVPRYEITQIPKETDIPYCVLEVERWLPLPRPVLPGEKGVIANLTTRYQLMNSRQVTELFLQNTEDYALFGKLRGLGEKRLPIWGFQFGAWRVRRFFRRVIVTGEGRTLRFSADQLRYTPCAVMEEMQKAEAE